MNIVNFNIVTYFNVIVVIEKVCLFKIYVFDILGGGRDGGDYGRGGGRRGGGNQFNAPKIHGDFVFQVKNGF